MAELNVLLIGDPTAVERMAKNVEDAGLRCEICSNGRRLAAVLRKGRHDVVLAHERGFAENGVKVLERVRGAVGGREGLVMLLTRNRPELIADAIEAGADDVLIWPTDSRELRTRLESVALGYRLRSELQLSLAGADSDTQRLLRNFDERYHTS